MQALVLIDLQRDFFDAGPLREQATSIVKHANELIEKAMAAGAPVLLVRTLHSPTGDTWALNMSEDGQGLVIEDTRGAEFLEDLATPGAIEVHKTRDSAFLRTGLESMLRGLGVDRVVLGGVSTEACVAVTAADAYARDFKVVLAVDTIASAQPDSHQPALEWLEAQYRQPALPNDQIDFATTPDQD